MDPQLPEVERLQVIDVQPGDTIVATVPANTRYEEVASLRDTLVQR